jgi:hypothetical protein
MTDIDGVMASRLNHKKRFNRQAQQQLTIKAKKIESTAPRWIDWRYQA